MKFYTLILITLIAISCRKENKISNTQTEKNRSEVEILKSHNWILKSYYTLYFRSSGVDTVDMAKNQGLINSCLVYSLGEPNGVHNNGYDWMQTDMCSSQAPADSLFTVIGIDTSTSPTTIAWGWYALYYELEELDDYNFKMLNTRAWGPDSSVTIIHFTAL